MEAEHQRLLEAGRLAFNRGEFYEAHEFWEEVWDVIDDPERTWIQGMIQVATGLHKLARDQRASARTLFAKALAKLSDAPELLAGLQLARLRGDAARVAAALDAGERPEPSSVRLWTSG
jgi:predicted metal-dependent hydrolase